MGAEEPDAGDELASRRSFVVPRILRPKEDREAEEEESEEEESTEKPRDAFVANPAELREQAEQRRLSRRGRGRPGSAPRQLRDVVGAPRGQGQEKDTIAARRHKSENKSRGANHNRRWQADRKRKEF
jgi:activating signal cointegrator complex subunit 2